jgi:hypothetical protein
MRRLLRRATFIAVVLFVLFGTFLGYLGANSGHPRASAGWIRLPNMPDPRGEFAAAVASQRDCADTDPACSDTKIIAVGGLEGLGKSVTTVSVYDPVAQEWSNGPALPKPRHHMGAASISGAMYVTGGSVKATKWKPESNLWLLRPDGKGWEVGPDMPEGRMGHQMVAIGSKLFVVGGRGETSNVLIYDTLRKSWSTGAQMPVPRDHLAAAVVGDKIFAIGGRDDDLLARVDIYDTAQDAWSDGPALPQPMSAMATAALSDGIHVVGGEDPATAGGKVLDLHVVLSPETGEWLKAPRALLPVHGAAAVAYDGSLVIIGGARRQGSLSPLGWTGLVQAFTPIPE